MKQIDENTWLTGNVVLHRSDTAAWNDGSDNSSYTLTKASSPLPTTTTANSPYIKLVHEAGDASAVWSIGTNAFCKVRYNLKKVTPESATLKFVSGKQPSYKTPEVFHYAFDDDTSYLFIQRLQGRTLDTAWPSLNDHWKRRYVDAVVEACLEMAKWEAPAIGGVDGQYIPEYFLTGHNADFSALRASCEEIGMNCSVFVFQHGDLGPPNIIVEEEPISGEIGFVDWEISGYLPRDWVRTKFRLSRGMDLPASASEHPAWWRIEIQKALGAREFGDYAHAWGKWQTSITVN